ncbi:MAG: NAD(P)H-binding protein [Myxococcales bacterium]|nr:NAD(P)H-binding protein [Myxococcales bacterium]
MGEPEGTRAFVVGATGLTGRAVVRALRDRGVETIAHVRSDSKELAAWRERFGALGARVDATPWDETAMLARLAAMRPTHVFALLGTTKARARRAAREGARESYEAVDYGLTARLLRAAQTCGSRPRFIYLSSMGVTAATRSPYLAARHRLETELQASELPWIIARPSFIVGERDESRPLEAVGASVGDGLLALVGLVGGGGIRERYRSQTGDELARALVRLALDEPANQVVPSDRLRALAGGATRA